MSKKIKYICNGALVLILIFIFIFWKDVDYGDTVIVQNAVSYEKGKVIKVLDEDTVESYPNLKTGSQKVLVEMKNKRFDKPITIENNLFSEHSVYLKEGSKVIVYVDEPKGIEPYYTIYNYDRSVPIAIMLILFLIMLYAIGKSKGIKSAASLFISLYLMFCFMIPLIYLGHSPVWVTILTCVLGSIYSVVILQGYTLIGLVNLISVSVGFISAAICFYISSYFTHLSGYNLADVEGLLLINSKTGLQIYPLMFAGVAIAAYGACKDVSVSISSALHEIYVKNPKITKIELFKSGMVIGKDIIGTMVDTLVFAFLGSSIATVLVLISYGVDFNQLVSSDFFAVELVNSLIGTAVVIIMVPVSAYLSGVIYKKEKIKLKRR